MEENITTILSAKLDEIHRRLKEQEYITDIHLQHAQKVVSEARIQKEVVQNLLDTVQKEGYLASGSGGIPDTVPMLFQVAARSQDKAFLTYQNALEMLSQAHSQLVDSQSLMEAYHLKQ
jgi:hypothetical protein